MSKSVLLMFAPRNLMISVLKFRSLIHLSLFFSVMWENILVKYSSVIILHVPAQFSHFFNRRCLFSFVCFCFLCYKLTIIIWVYFWVLYSVPLFCMSVFVPITWCFDYCKFVVFGSLSFLNNILLRNTRICSFYSWWHFCSFHLLQILTWSMCVVSWTDVCISVGYGLGYFAGIAGSLSIC